MAKSTRKAPAKKYMDIWARNAFLERRLREQNKLISDLKWDMRALKVQLYSEKQYADRYADYHRGADVRRYHDPVDGNPDSGGVKS